MQREYFENLIINDIKNYNILFGLFGILASCVDGKLYFSDLEQKSKINIEEDGNAYRLLTKNVCFKIEPQLEIGGLMITFIDKRVEENKARDKMCSITIFPEDGGVVVDNKRGTKISVFNSHKSLLIDSDYYSGGYYKFNKLMDDPYKVGITRDSFRTIDHTCGGVMEYVKAVSPNVVDSISLIMGDGIAQPPRK